jgi:pimeloyl-ACP methyl ester carboxylesterase
MNNQFGEYYLEAIGETYTEEGKRPGGWMVWAQYVSMGQRHDYRLALAAVSAPVLVLHGVDDLQSEAASRMYAEAFPNSTFDTIPASSHAPFSQNPEEFSRILNQFLEEIQ